MQIFFFYDKITNVELIKEITNNFIMEDGYVTKNGKVLKGKIVFFNAEFYDILQKINDIHKEKNENKKYILDNVEAYSYSTNGDVYQANIIY